MKKFSVIIPTYNASLTIKKTIESCINQTHKIYEIIIIDDCSSDDTIKIIYDNFNMPELRIIKLDVNKGVSNARNTGWDLAMGDYVSFLDADDIWHPNKLEIINNIILSTEIKCLGNAYTDDNSLLSNPNDELQIEKLSFRKLILRNYFNTSCLIIDKNLDFRFDPGMRYTEDHELLLRISSRHPVFFVKAKLTLLGRPQLSKGGLSGNKFKMRIGEINMYRKTARVNKTILFLLPFLITYSIAKHLAKIFR